MYKHVSSVHPFTFSPAASLEPLPRAGDRQQLGIQDKSHVDSGENGHRVGKRP